MIAGRALALAARAFDPETAHGLAIRLLRTLPSGAPPAQDARLACTVAGLHLPSPLGLAAGFDKNAEVPAMMLRLGFGFVEVGTLAPRPQPGNPRPRLFRLPAQGALINRFGFNNDGFAPALARLQKRPRTGIVGVNVGANKDAGDRIADYALGIETFFDVADYFTVNVSSPNTPGLRDLQEASAMQALLGRVMERHGALARPGRTPPVFVKIAPDMDDDTLEKLARVITGSGAHGIIVSNTTVSRPVPEDAPNRGETGGLSGRPLFALSTRMLARTRQAVGPGFPLIGVGGIHDAASALEKIAAGADLVQLYSAMAFAGFGLAGEINRGIAAALDKGEIASLDALRGSRTDEWARRSA